MKEKKNLLLGSAIMLFMLSLLNKGLGFVKTMAIAFVFGADAKTDIYYVAEGLMQNVLIPMSDAVAVSFLPIYIGIKGKDRQDSRVFTCRTITDIFLLALILSGLLYITSPLLFKVIFPSYTEKETAIAVSYFRLLIWGMCFYMSNQLLQSLLNAEKEYGFSSFSAMLNNLILTIAVVFMGHRFGLQVMAVAVPFSYFIQYLFLQIRSNQYGRLTFGYGFRDLRIKQLCVRVMPIFFGNAIYELNSLVDRSLLSRMESGSVTAVSYAAVLYQFASSLISVPMTTIIYTELSELFAARHMEEGGRKVEKGIYISLFFCIPISLFVMVSSRLIVGITYGRGAFGTQAVLMTSQGLQYYGLCFMAYCINALMVRACYSLGDTILPMKIGIGTVSLNIILSIVLSQFWGLRGVVLATAISNTFTSLITLYVFNRTKLSINLGRLIKPSFRIILSSVAATIICAAWMYWIPITNEILLFVTSACLEFGIYAVFVILCKDEMGIEIFCLLKSLIGRRQQGK